MMRAYGGVKNLVQSVAKKLGHGDVVAALAIEEIGDSNIVSDLVQGLGQRDA